MSNILPNLVLIETLVSCLMQTRELLVQTVGNRLALTFIYIGGKTDAQDGNNRRCSSNLRVEVNSMRVIIDRVEGDYYVGRTEFCSPEVDPEVLIPVSETLSIGAFYDVKMTDSEAFDLYGTTNF